MNPSAPFIARPVATILLTIGVALAGFFAFLRSALYPLSEDGVAIDHVLGAANYRPLRENEKLIMPLIRIKCL